MRRIGLTTVALIVGCAGGVAIREVVFPAHAAPGVPTYSYKVYDVRSFGAMDDEKRFEAVLNQLGQAGMRYAGCIPTSASGCLYFAVEQPVAAAPRASAPPPGAP